MFNKVSDITLFVSNFDNRWTVHKNYGNNPNGIDIFRNYLFQISASGLTTRNWIKDMLRVLASHMHFRGVC